MSCAETRELLLRMQPVERHLEECAGCGRFAWRLQAVKDGLRDHHADLEPDTGFVDRVLLHLPDGSSQTIGWAAMRLLPFSAALLLLLVWLALQTSPVPQESPAPENEMEAYMAWVLDPSSPAGEGAP